MKRYKDLSGKSGISHYEIGVDFIRVKFIGTKDIYIYSEKKIKRKHIAEMKKLAAGGSGLSTYISQHSDVRDHFTLEQQHLL